MVTNYLVICVIAIGIIALIILGFILVEDHRKIYSDIDYWAFFSPVINRPKVKGVIPTDYYLLRKEIDGNGSKINSYFDSMFYFT